MKRSLTKTCLICGLLISFLFSCKKDKEDNATTAPSGIVISGKAQKGPFKTGSDVVINEMNSRLEETGISYTTTVTDNAGSFSLNNISISTGYTSITATGYYYMEHFNLYSPYRLSMEAVADVQSSSAINVNLLTHLIKPRIEKLVVDGNTFFSARTQAQNELKSFLRVSSSDSMNFEKLDVTNSNLLFAISLLFQRRTFQYSSSYNYVNEFNQLINRFRNDFKDNGQIDSHDIIDTLIYNANRIELIDTKASFETYMTSLGVTTSLTGFEQYIYAFQKAYSPQVYLNYVFPDPAIYERDFLAPQTNQNLLYDTSVTFQRGNYNMTAIVPCDSSLIIKFTKLSQSQYSFGYVNYGWSLTTLSNGFTIEAERKNYPNAMLLNLWSSATVDSARVEYFKNNQPVPYFSKTIYWQ